VGLVPTRERGLATGGRNRVGTRFGVARAATRAAPTDDPQSHADDSRSNAVGEGIRGGAARILGRAN